MNKIIVVDIDGTMTIVGNRLRFLDDDSLTKKEKYKNFYGACDEDEPKWHIVDLVNLLAMKFHIVFITGRHDSSLVREKTFQWLKAYCKFPVTHENLMMRPEGNDRHDIKVKPELLTTWLRKNDRKESEIEFFLEDRNSMVDKWRDLGYTVLQVAEGDF